jgi:hypothetical protein
MRHLAISKNGSAVRPGTWPRWCCDLDCAAEPPACALCCWLLRSHTLTASALVPPPPPPLPLPPLCCRRAKQEVQISSFTKRKGSRRTAPPLPPPPARAPRTPPSLFFLIWTPEENIYTSGRCRPHGLSRTFRRRFAASLSLCPGFLQRHAAPRHHCRHRCEPSFTHTSLSPRLPPTLRARTAPIFLHFHCCVLLLC